MSDVLQEAHAVKTALAELNWTYVGGGPYPHKPTMNFTRKGETLTLTLAIKET